MLKGDLAATPLAEVLRQLADGAATGCVNLADPAGETAKVYLRGGRVYAVVAPGNRPALGSRLVSSGALGPEALAEALEAQRTELQGWRLGELLVHLGYVDQPVVEDFVNEQVRGSLSDLLPWGSGTWKFRVNEKTREDVAPPVPVDQLLAEISERQATWASLLDVLHGPDAVPLLSAAGSSDAELEIDPDAWSLLCKVDGSRTLTDLARECGFTLYEAGRVVHGLVGAGLLQVEEPAGGSYEEEPAAEAFVPADVASRLVSAFSGRTSVPSQGGSPDLERADEVLPAEARSLVVPPDEQEVDGSITRVSAALAALLGPATANDDVFSAPMHRPPVDPVAPVAVDPKKAERLRREAARRAADAEELATAQADLEAARSADDARRAADLPDGHVAEVVDLGAARVAAERVAAEQAEAERVAAQAEAEPLAAEQAERLAAEAAEQERLAAEQAEADRLAAEAAEQERLAAEQAEAERIAAEQGEAERLEAERLEAERLAAEQAEAERAAAEQAEAERLAAEAAEQERLAAEQAECERLAAEQADVERLAAEAAEQERIAAEQAEAERLAAEQAEAERIAAEAAEQARLAAEQAEAERLAAEAAEQERLAAEAAAAELASFVDDEPMSQIDSREDAEAQAAAFAELSASASLDVPEPVVAAAAPDDEEAYPDDEPMPSYAHDTDTASLLRELSSLGLDDDAPAAQPTRPARPPAPRAAPASAQKKRKGLFGRG